jgi:hypothetical protein
MPTQRKYCGLKEPLPQGYTRYGDRYQCLRSGVGIGKNLPRNGQVRAPPPTIVTISPNRWYLMISISLIIANVILIVLILTTPKKDNKDK